MAPQLTRSDDLQRSLTITTAVLAVAGIVLYLFLFTTSQETVERDAGSVSLKQTFGTIRHNRPLLLLCLSALFALTGMFTLQTRRVQHAAITGEAESE